MNKNFALAGWIGMALLIFYSSGQPYSKQDMRTEISAVFVNLPRGLLQKLEWISFSYAGKAVSIEALGVGGFIEFLIRKAAHFGAFFLLTFFFYCFIRHIMRSDWQSGLTAFAFGLLYAASDELHQMYTGDRTPLIQDVCLDGSGVIFGLLLGICMMRRYKRKRQT